MPVFHSTLPVLSLFPSLPELEDTQIYLVDRDALLDVADREFLLIGDQTIE